MHAEERVEKLVWDNFSFLYKPLKYWSNTSLAVYINLPLANLGQSVCLCMYAWWSLRHWNINDMPNNSCTATLRYMNFIAELSLSQKLQLSNTSHHFTYVDVHQSRPHYLPSSSPFLLLWSLVQRRRHNYHLAPLTNTDRPSNNHRAMHKQTKCILDVGFNAAVAHRSLAHRLKANAASVMLKGRRSSRWWWRPRWEHSWAGYTMAARRGENKWVSALASGFLKAKSVIVSSSSTLARFIWRLVF